MTLPLLGPMTLSGFAHAWFFVFLLVIVGLVALYIIAQVARQRRREDVEVGRQDLRDLPPCTPGRRERDRKSVV